MSRQFFMTCSLFSGWPFFSTELSKLHATYQTEVARFVYLTLLRRYITKKYVNICHKSQSDLLRKRTSVWVQDPWQPLTVNKNLRVTSWRSFRRLPGCLVDQYWCCPMAAWVESSSVRLPRELSVSLQGKYVVHKTCWYQSQLGT